MKKISFGSFPLIDMNHSDRKCIDKYSMKSYADLITLNSQIGHISNDVDQYVTPDIILKYFKNSKNENPMDDNVESSANRKRNTLKRAFNSLKAYHKAIQKDGFYRDFTTYPIYIEHAGNNNNHDYDFILLSNDLQKKEILDGIKYDDRITLVFLFLKDMLYPNIPLNEIGNSGSYDLRRDVAKFIEYSKQSGIDPVTAFIRFIKLAGYSKQNKKGDFKISNIIKNSSLFSNGISDKLWALFGGSREKSEIKDISFMTSVKQSEIAKFFDEYNTNNASSHIGDNSTTYLERQFNLSKTHEYNKILSLLDSLMSFNNQSEILSDNQYFDSKIILNNGDHEFEARIQYEQVVAQVRNNYFESFMVNLIHFMDNELDKLVSNKVKKDNHKDKNDIELKLRDQINELQMELVNTTDLTTKRELQHAINNNQSLLNKIQMEQAFVELYNAKKEIVKDNQSTLKYNLQNVQSELTGILMDFEKIIYDEQLFNELIQTTGNRKSPSLEEVKNLKAFKFLTISKIRLNESLIDSLNHHIRYEYKAEDKKNDKDTALSELAKNLKKISDDLNTALDKNIFQLFLKIGRDFGDAKSHITRQYVDLRVEKNPVIRRTVMRPNNFKTYILNSDVLTSLYDLLHYADNQKYLSGLIKYPPSRISGDYAKIKYCVNRLGLDKNPVFIVGQGLVTLSNPDTLSLTGGNIYSQISMTELSKSCNINYDRDVWDDKGILAQIMSDIKYNRVSQEAKKIPELSNVMDKAREKVKTLGQGKENKKERERLNKVIRDTEARISKIKEKQKDLDSAYPELMRNMTSRGQGDDYKDDRLSNPRDHSRDSRNRQDSNNQYRDSNNQYRDSRDPRDSNYDPYKR